MNDYTKSFIPGFISGTIKIIIGYPFETIKIRKQLDKNYSIKNINSLYKGCSIPLLISSTKRGLQLSIYDNYKDKNTYLAGALGGMISSLALNPINIIRTNLQSKKYNNIRSQLNINTLYRGNIINIFRDTIFSTYYLGTYGYIKNKFPDKPQYHSLSGMISGSSLWILFSPIDYIRTLSYNGESYKNIYKHVLNNPKNMWKGCKPMIIKSIPLNLVNMTIYEYLKVQMK